MLDRTLQLDPRCTMVASGLSNPRKLVFAGGDIFVTEAGVGGNGSCLDGRIEKVRYETCRVNFPEPTHTRTGLPRGDRRNYAGPPIPPAAAHRHRSPLHRAGKQHVGRGGLRSHPTRLLRRPHRAHAQSGPSDLQITADGRLRVLLGLSESKSVRDNIITDSAVRNRF